MRHLVYGIERDVLSLYKDRLGMSCHQGFSTRVLLLVRSHQRLCDKKSAIHLGEGWDRLHFSERS